MSITKIVAILIPFITLILWIYFFITEKVSVIKFYLVLVLVPLGYASLYIAFKVWGKSRANSAIVRS